MTIESVMRVPEPVDHAALAETIPLDEIDVSNPALYQQDVWQPYFRRLRREAPVHYCKESPVGPYWSVTRHKDIIALEVDHRRFSSSSTFGGITLRDRSAGPNPNCPCSPPGPRRNMTCSARWCSRLSRPTISPISRA